jgi:hypothetical protein
MRKPECFVSADTCFSLEAVNCGFQAQSNGSTCSSKMRWVISPGCT